ncbi:AraC family transcriptional regulator [Streptomyces sp. NPDC050287]|uniref:AraC family transcriptional regulator n=1 Tax=Streptomyces sp. NPDC050287 TaxID=3365608 RepID=UPI00379C5833
MSLMMPAPADTARPTDTRTLGFVRVTTYRGAARPVVHDPESATRPYLLLGLHTTGRATLDRRGTTEACGPDDLFLCDGTEPFVLHQAGDFVLHLVRIPRHALAVTDRQVRALTDRAPFADGPVAPLLGSLLRQLAAAPGQSSGTALRLSASIAELVALLAAAEDLDPGPKDHGREREALVRRLRAYVDAHLWDRNLTPASVAAAQHISLRYLHRLFEDQGSTVGRWIQHRRLEEARRELARPGRADITVAAVARRWGFASASHFSRSFRAAYGIAPSDWRDGRTRPSGQTAQNPDV